MRREIIDASTPKPWRESGWVGDFAPRELYVPYGKTHEGHAHHTDHITFFLDPALVICKLFEDPLDEKSKLLDEWEIEIREVPWVLNMPAQVWHQIVPLRPPGCTRFCIWAGYQADATGLFRNDFNFERPRDG